MVILGNYQGFAADFYRLDVLTDNQPTVLVHWRNKSWH